MKKVKIPFFGILISLMLVGSAFAVDITGISTWTQSMGVGGGGPGRGDVLLGPLYDVRNLSNTNTGENVTFLGVPVGPQSTQQTFITIVNTDNFNGYIGRLRFREWKRSREVFDIDIPLSKNDVFVAEISLGADGIPVIHSPDRYVSSVTATHFNTAPWPAAGFQFSNFDLEIPLNGTPMPEAAKPRLTYGYIEFIGEERVAPEWDATFRFARLGDANRDARNVLMGNVYLIRPEVQISHQYNFTALTNFAINPNGIWQPPQNQRPTLLQDVQGYAGNPGIGGFDQLESILSKRWVYFTYVNGVEATTNTPMNTSVVVTFPTKLFHYTKTAPFPRIQVPPWFPPFTGTHETPDDAATGGELIDYAIFNRSEKRLDRPDLPPISPPPPPGARPRLPWEVNIVGLYPTDPPTIKFTRDNVGIATASPLDVFQEGWGWLDLSPFLFAASETREAPQGEGGQAGVFDNIGRPGAPWLAATVPAYAFDGFNFFGNPFNVYYGLPAIGIIMTEFYNDSVGGYYGNTVPWQYEVEWYNLP
jgi:hypothetical protein